jgi:hypothetical protein
MRYASTRGSALAHHIQPLGRPHCGPDCIENLIVVCPNHHAMCDYGAIKLALTDLHVIAGHCIKRLGFAERIRGDHYIFTKEGVEEILNLQPKGAQAKSYQVKQVRGVIVKYRLAGDANEK